MNSGTQLHNASRPPANSFAAALPAFLVTVLALIVTSILFG